VPFKDIQQEVWVATVSRALGFVGLRVCMGVCVCVSVPSKDIQQEVWVDTVNHTLASLCVYVLEGVWGWRFMRGYMEGSERGWKDEEWEVESIERRGRKDGG